jgi:hypothetical protein
MRELLIEATEESPSITVKGGGTVLSVSGRSTSAMVAASFRQVALWLDEFGREEGSLPLKFEFKLEYYNTLTSRLLLDILFKMEKLFEKGHDITVDWYYEKFDTDLREAGEAYSAMVSIPFNFIPQ